MYVPLRLEMVEGKQARFLVTSEITDKPIPGAIVRFGYPDRRQMETGEDGIVTIPGLLSQEYDVTIEAKDHARAIPQIDLAHVGAISEYKTTLSAGGIARGVVLDDQGQLISDADVVYREPSSPIGFHGDSFRTDREGRFQHRFLPLNTPIDVSVGKEGYLGQRKEIVLTAAQPLTELTIALAKRPRGGAVTGVVVDQKGQPVAGATVAGYSYRPDANASITTDPDGKFLIDDLVEGSAGYEITVSAKNFAPQLVPVKPGSLEKPGSVSVTLGPGHTIHGRVVNEQGEPLRQAFISVRSSVYAIGFGEPAYTDDDGIFVLDSLPRDATFDVSVPSYSRKSNLRLQLNSNGPITITLELPGVLRGIVVDTESGEPVRQFRVRVGSSRLRRPSDPSGSYSAEWSNPGLTFNSTEGRFVVEPLTDGLPVELTVEADGYEREVIPRAVATKADRENEIKIALRRAKVVQPFTLTGQLLNHAGRPAAGAQLRLIVSTDQPTGLDDNDFNWALIDSGHLAQKPYCEQYLSAITDAEGRFEFQNILPGKYLQLAYWGEGVPKGRSLAFDETRPGESDSVTIKLPQPATIRGTLDRVKFENVGSIQLSMNRESWHSYEIKLEDERSTFEFHDLPPGDYSLGVASTPVRFTENGNTFFRSSWLAHQKFQLKAGETKEVQFTEPDKLEK